MSFRRPHRIVAHDSKMSWRGSPRRRPRVRVRSREAERTEEFMQHATLAQRSSKRLKWILAFVISVSVLGGLSYIVFFSGYFTVRNIIVLNTSVPPTISSERIEQYLIQVRGKNIFLVHASDVIKEILNRNVRIQFIQAERILPDSLRITITEYPIVAHLWQGETNDNVLVNDAGFVVKQIPDPENYGQYIQIKTFDRTIWKEDRRAVDRADLAFMLDLVASFENQFGVEVERVDYYPDRREAHLVTVRGWMLLVDFNRTVDESLADLILAFEEASIAKDSFSSIDLRIPGKVFVCRRPGSCIPQVPVEESKPFYAE